MDNMIKFYRGLVSNLPAAGANGALYITTDEGAIYYGTGTGMKRLGDFVQVDNVASLPEKAHESCLYYCVAENILAKWNGTEWKQINKQPTAEEMKTLLGLGSLAYLSEVTEDNLDSALKEKVNAAAEGNHSHSNKALLDTYTQTEADLADAVAKKHSHTFTDEDVVDAISKEHTHTFADSDVEDAISKKHAHTFVDTDVEDAIAKKHSHSFVETELNKIADGDVAKWNAVVADHLTSEDKTALENSIKEAKKAGTDANTNIEAYKVTNDARVLAVEEDIAEITGENGLLAQAKSYSDGKLATARTEISAEIDADVKVVADDLAGYKTSNDSALAGVKATAEAAATKTYTDEELAKKVDKVEGKSLVLDTEITKLAGVSEGANKVENVGGGKIKIDGTEVTVYAHPEKHSISEVDGLQDALDGKQAAGNYSVEGHKHVKADITDFAHTHVASEITDLDSTIKGYDYATKTELGNVDKKFENYKTAEAQKAIDDEQDRRLGVIEGDYLKAADIADFETKENVKKVADDLAAYVESNDAAIADRYTKAEADGKFAIKGADAYDDTALSNRVKAIEDDYLVGADKTELAGLVTAEKERAEGIEGGFETRIKAIEDDYLVEADKTALQEQITANANAITLLTNGASAEEVDGVNDLIQYVKEHGTEVTGMKEDIAENAKAISDHEALAAETYETKTDAGNKLTEAKTYADGLNTAMDTRVKALEDHKDDYIAAVEEAKTEAANQDAVVLSEAQKYTDAAKDAAIADAASKYETIGTAQGIVDGLKLSETYEPIGAEGRAIAAAKTETENQVKALADGQVATNKNDIASIMELLTWGSF